jgi:hypothetical protein
MTTFLNGPAKGQTLMLHNSPRWLRVTCGRGKWDALDQWEDSPLPDELIYCYQLAEITGHAHINMGRGRGGFYPIASYRYVEPQPDERKMRSNELWVKWSQG